MKNLLTLAVLAAAFFSGHAVAGTDDSGTFTFNCSAKKMPTQQVFGKVMGLYNLAETYDERVRMRSNLLHQCQSQKIKSIIVQARPARMLMVAKN